MGRLIDVDEVKKQFPIMENDFGMVINERLHKELDKIPTVEAIPLRIIDDIKAEIESIEITGQVDERTSFIRTGEQVKNLTIKIIDKYTKEGESKE